MEGGGNESEALNLERGRRQREEEEKEEEGTEGGRENKFNLNVLRGFFILCFMFLTPEEVSLI